MKFCTKCGLKEHDNSAIFCKKCGNKLTSTKYFPKTREELDELLDRHDVEYSEIDVSEITDMSYLFIQPKESIFLPYNKSYHVLDKDTAGLIYWDVSNVKNMEYMFCGATSFNQPIGNWDVSNVENMSSMFEDATSFNQPIGNWNISNVKDRDAMFENAISFNQSLEKWNTKI